MILQLDHGYTLKCSGCDGFRSLTMRELRDMDRVLDIKSAMKEIHKHCDSYHDKAKAKAAIKARIQAERRVALGGATQ